jgi:hypothetical protein
MTFKQFVKRNESERVFSDISNEAVRTYLYANGSKVVIDDPIALHVSKSGHYVVRADGLVTFLPYGSNGWIALQFATYGGAASMTF